MRKLPNRLTPRNSSYLQRLGDSRDLSFTIGEQVFVIDSSGRWKGTVTRINPASATQSAPTVSVSKAPGVIERRNVRCVFHLYEDDTTP